MKAWIALAALLVTTTVAARTAIDPRARMATATAQADAARARSADLDRRARSAGDAAARARALQAAVAARIQAAEADVAAAEARLALVDRLRRAQERRLAAREQPIVGLASALQTMARRPAAAALVQPGTIADLVHVRALLATMAPQIAARTRALREDVARVRLLRRRAARIAVNLRDGQRRQRVEQQRLVGIEAEQRRRSAQFASTARLEATRAALLGERSRTLEELMGVLGREAVLRDRLASLPGPLPRPARLGASLPPDQRAPARSTPLAYRLPVLGPVTRGFGESLPSGARSRGVTIAARPGAIVVAPAAGRVTFAGLYRGYGSIAIVDHGGGHVSLVTGLAANIARIGDTVAQGGPLGRGGANGVTVELRRAGQAIDFTTLVG